MICTIALLLAGLMPRLAGFDAGSRSRTWHAIVIRGRQDGGVNLTAKVEATATVRPAASILHTLTNGDRRQDCNVKMLGMNVQVPKASKRSCQRGDVSCNPAGPCADHLVRSRGFDTGM